MVDIVRSRLSVFVVFCTSLLGFRAGGDCFKTRNCVDGSVLFSPVFSFFFGRQNSKTKNCYGCCCVGRLLLLCCQTSNSFQVRCLALVYDTVSRFLLRILIFSTCRSFTSVQRRSAVIFTTWGDLLEHVIEQLLSVKYNFKKNSAHIFSRKCQLSPTKIKTQHPTTLPPKCPGECAK